MRLWVKTSRNACSFPRVAYVPSLARHKYFRPISYFATKIAVCDDPELKDAYEQSSFMLLILRMQNEMLNSNDEHCTIMKTFNLNLPNLLDLNEACII